MLLPPGEVSRQIKLIATSEANAVGVTLDQAALDQLATVPPPYSRQGQIDVDIPELRQTIRGILEQSRNYTVSNIDVQLLDQMLGTWHCHYLWFC